jgi:hypothetical protein
MLTRRDQALKDDCRRDVPLWLAELKLPEVHSLELYGLPLDRILEDSLFYPAAGIDGRPIQFLAGFINSFIYADYGLGPLELEDAMLNAAFLGYRISGKRSLPQDDLVPKGWLPVIPQKYQKEVRWALSNLLLRIGIFSIVNRSWVRLMDRNDSALSTSAQMVWRLIKLYTGRTVSRLKCLQSYSRVPASVGITLTFEIPMVSLLGRFFTETMISYPNI